MIQNIPSHSGVWKKSDPSESPKSAELVEPPQPFAQPQRDVAPGAYAIPASDTPPASELSIPSKNPSPKSLPVVDADDHPTRHTHAHGSVVIAEAVVVGVDDPVGDVVVVLPGLD